MRVQVSTMMRRLRDARKIVALSKIPIPHNEKKKEINLSDLLSVNHFSMLIFQLNRCLLLVVQLDCFSTHPLMVVYIGHQDSHSDFALVDEYRFCQDT